MSVFGDYKKEVMSAAYSNQIRVALSRAIKSYRENVHNVLDKFPHTIELAEEVRKIKEESINNIEALTKQACESIQQNKGKAYVAATAEEALNIIGEITGTGKLIVKGKSMTGEEIGLREHLEKIGNEVYETDLGEFIIQKMGSRPMHITAPSIHVPKEEVAKLFSEITGKQLPADIPTLVATARDLLRDKYFKADIGISGANVVAADTGGLVIIENEGNVRISTSVPPVHIALVGIEKIVPTLSDAFKVAEVTWRHAGYSIPKYLSVISGPSATGDIEKVTTYGAHGPKEFHVIFLDAGRSSLAKEPVLRQALYCLRCGGCLFECPVFAVTAGHFGDTYFAGMGAIWASIIRENDEKAAALAYTCLTCGRCKTRCPVSIDVPEMIVELRKSIAEGQ
jgi:L-lactate dehydrogenase complex protein LldG